MAKRKRGRKPTGAARAPKAKKKQQKTESDAPAEPASRRHLMLNMVAGLTVVGVLLTGYLTVSSWLAAELPYCGADSACDLVQSSRWSTLLGLPLSLWGLLTYVLIGALVWRAHKHPAAWGHALFVTCIGVGISLYLTAISVFVIEATCAYCLASAVLITVIFALLSSRKPANIQGFRWATWLPTTVLTAAVVVGGLHLHYSGVFDPAAGPEKPYLKALAIHLTETGAKFYGAYWCPRCNEQKEMFEASAGRLPYVECSPHGRRGPRTATCTTLRINNYPTWIIGGRRHTGVIQPATLAHYSNFRWDGVPPE